MDATRKLFQQAVKLYGSMSRIQRGTIAAASVVLIVAFVFVIANAGRATTMKPLFNGRELSVDELKPAESTLKLAGIGQFERRGHRLFVPETELRQCELILTNSNAVATDSRSEREKQFEKHFGPFSRKQQQDEAREIALQNELRRIIRSIPGIKDATVIWARGQGRRIGRARQPVTATVNVFPDVGFQLSPSLVQSLRSAVANMIPDLDAAKIVIFDQSTGRTYSAGNDGSDVVSNGDRSIKPTNAQLVPETQSIAGESKSNGVNAAGRQASAANQQHGSAGDVHEGRSDSGIDWLLKWLPAAAVVAVCVIGLRRRRDAMQRDVSYEIVPDDAEPESNSHESDETMENDETVSSANGDAIDVLTELESDRVELSAAVQPHLEETHATPVDSIAFDFLRRTSKERLSSLIRNERPQTIAVILSHLPADLSTELLDQLPPHDESEVLERMQQLDRVAPEAIAAIRLSLKNQISDSATVPSDRYQLNAPSGKAAYVSEPAAWNSMVSLGNVGFPTAATIDKLQRPTMRFDQISALDDYSMSELVRSIDHRQWTYALSGADATVKQRVFERMSVQDSEMLKIELQQLGPVRLSDVDAMQREVTNRMCELTRRDAVHSN